MPSRIAPFVWFISRIFSINEQYFSLTTNQPTVLSAMSYQPSEQGKCQNPSNTKFSISFTLCFCYNNESISLTCANFTKIHQNQNSAFLHSLSCIYFGVWISTGHPFIIYVNFSTFVDINFTAYPSQHYCVLQDPKIVQIPK